MDEEQIVILILIVTVLGVLVYGVWIEHNLRSEIKDLAQSICEENFDADYLSYSDGVLECQEAPETESYDGLKVRIRE